MRTIDFNEYNAGRQKFIKQRAALDLRRGPSRRWRDAQERALLLRLDRARWQKWLATGRLKKIGNRLYVLISI